MIIFLLLLLLPEGVARNLDLFQIIICWHLVVIATSLIEASRRRYDFLIHILNINLLIVYWGCIA